MEHTPWIGCNYKKGLQGQKICIVGYSHWRGSTPECRTFTTKVVRRVKQGKSPHNFFNAIRRYFGSDDHKTFWDTVLFFNYVPVCVGREKDRYKAATNEQLAAAKQRFIRIIKKHKPHKVLVFSRRAWRTMPCVREEPEGTDAPTLPGFAKPKFYRGTYAVATGHIVEVFGLRHPQGANDALMKNAVRHILSRPHLKS